MERTRKLTLLAMLIAMAITLHWVESFLPRPMPFLRFGFANILTLSALYLFGGLAALLVLISRVIIGSLLAGSIFTPTFYFSLAGGLAAAVVMWLMPKRIFSPIGVSVAGATAHMTTQIIMAGFIIQQMAITKILPLFLLVSIITGMLNGYCAELIIKTANRQPAHPGSNQ